MAHDPNVLHALLKQLTEISKDHEKRIRWLERGGMMLMGAFVVIKLLIHQ